VAGAAAGFQFAVLGGGVNMPIVKAVETQPLPVEQAPPPAAPPAAASVAAPVPPAPIPYVAPVYPRKQDRN
jgi:pyruvate dehydrogenase E2 component (dihydrolipoamide acetyltransferase)